MPFLDSRFVDLLRCPASRLPLREASLAQLMSLGLSPQRCHGWDAGLLRADGRGAYPLRKGIPVLLVEELVPLESVLSSPPSAGSGTLAS